MSKLLIILSPPRSFSSIVSTMLGQHPDLYGFPELRLFLGDTVQEVIEFSRQKDPEQEGRPAGLLRTLAQLHDGVQNDDTVLKAYDWLNQRLDWPTKYLFDYLLEKISPKMGVEKTPQTCLKDHFLAKAYEFFPDAYYLHLTRHPVSTRMSMLRHGEARQLGARREKKKHRNVLDPIYRWDRIHTAIINLTGQLPPGQTLRIKGEDLLSEPEQFLPQITRWLGVRTDPQAIAAMKHPELSPYACLGPSLAPGGNNLEFLQNPYLLPKKIPEPSLQEFWAQQEREFRDEFGMELLDDQEANASVTRLAQMMSYY